MRTIQALLIPVILFSIQQTALAQSKGAIAIEDCEAFENAVDSKSREVPSNKTLQIKAGEIFSLNSGRNPYNSGKLDGKRPAAFSGRANGLIQLLYLSDPNGVTNGMAVWVPEKSVRIFSSQFSFPVDTNSEDKKYRWTDNYVYEAKNAAPKDVQAKMDWADPIIKRVEEKRSAIAAAKAAERAANAPTGGPEIAQQKTDPAKPAPLTGGPGTYLINHENEIWKNNDSQYFRKYGQAIIDIFVTDADLYVAGFIEGSRDYWHHDIDPPGKAAYWKNGELHKLEATVVSAATAIYVSDGNVYVAGIRGAGTAMRPVLWKNGEVLELSDKRGDDAWIPSGIHVKGSDITIVGATDSWGDPKLYSWKNGVEKDPMPNLKVPMTNIRGQQTGRMRDLGSNKMNVKVFNGDIYVGGQVEQQGKNAYSLRAWKNGQPIARATVEANISSSSDISFYATENYVVFYTDTQIWKNGAQIKVETFEDPTTLEQRPYKIHSVCASGEDVYAFGTISGRSALWKNGKASYYRNPNSNIVEEFFAPSACIVKN
jgi:hypothetical protein